MLTLFVRTEDINDETCLCALGGLALREAAATTSRSSSIFCEDIPLRFSVKASDGGSGAVYVSGYFAETPDDAGDDEGYGSGARVR